MSKLVKTLCEKKHKSFRSSNLLEFDRLVFYRHKYTGYKLNFILDYCLDYRTITAN